MVISYRIFFEGGLLSPFPPCFPFSFFLERKRKEKEEKKTNERSYNCTWDLATKLLNIELRSNDVRSWYGAQGWHR